MLYFPSITIFFSVIFTYWCIKYYIERRHLYRHLGKIDGPSGLPFLGSALSLLGSTETIINKIITLVNKYKSPWKIWLGGRAFIVLTDPADVEVVLNKCLAKVSHYHFTEILFGEGLFTAPIAKWKKHRKLISTTFKPQNLNNYVEIFSMHSDVLVERMREYVGKGIFDIQPLMRQLSLGVTSDSVIGTTNTTAAQRYHYAETLTKALDLVFFRFFRFWLHPDFLWRMSSHSKQLQTMSVELQKFISKILHEKQVAHKETLLQKESWEELPKGKCFMDQFVQISDKWSDSEVFDEAQTIVGAGTESLIMSPCAVLIMLGMHPEIQERVYQEIESIFGNSTRSITHKDLNKMMYLERVIKETLRLFPVLVIIARSIDKDITIKSHTIPKGCECFVGILHIHRNPDIWKDPLKFDPDRFLPEEAAKRHPYSYLSFSAGPRNCMGFKFALMSMKTVIASIVRNFRVSTNYQDISEIKCPPGILFKFAGGYKIAVENRI